MLTLLRRSKGYLPLPSGYPAGSTVSPQGSRLLSTAACLLVGSVVLNVYMVLSRRWTPPSALENYQHLNDHPIINQSIVPPLHSEGRFDNAVVTSLFTSAFAPAIATLGQSLDAVNSNASRILLYLPDAVSDEALCVATVSGFQPQPVQRIPPPRAGVYKHFLDQFSKLWLWKLDTLGVRAAVYLDADTLVLRNFDELFGLPYTFAAVPDIRLDRRAFTTEFNAGVMFLRPDSAVFEDMLAKIATADYPMVEAEQSFFNHYFGVQALRLPIAYNANLAIKKRVPEMWADLVRDARVLHYTMVKPFLGPDYEMVPLERMDATIEECVGANGGYYADEVLEWKRQWTLTKATYGDAIAACRAQYGASTTVTS